MIRRVFYGMVFPIFFFSCEGVFNQDKFDSLSPEESGITFSNLLFESDSINTMTFEYIYNGAGVAVGDLNNDGLEDIFFAGNMVSSELYLNQGNLIFRNVTQLSGAATSRWCTGVSIIDVNEDGLKDIYICVAGFHEAERANIMLINEGIDAEGIPHFSDRAKEMGLDDEGYSTMGVFFDYDKDNDLDLFILTNAMDGSMRSAVRDIRKDGTGESTDRLYRNEGHGNFVDVSIAAGIVNEGYGLGVGICDVNQDGWLDVYCANDFISNDLFYLNNQDGTFSEQSADYFKHFTHNGMGMDIADINNDALPDVFVLDMLPEDNTRQKLMIASNTMTFNKSVQSGYHPQFLRNTLQLNRGIFPDGKNHFSEISYLAGVYQTDWSWSSLMIDLDNDGWKDISITNGFRKDVTNLDYIQRIIEVSRFGTKEANKLLYLDEVAKLPEVKLRNYIFRNNGDLTFEDVSDSWGFDELTFTNGTAYADFDNDGDLDLVFNNLDQQATFYENKLTGLGAAQSHGFFQIKFDKAVSDAEKIGLKVWLFQGERVQYVDYNPFRGYKSTVGEIIHFGLGSAPTIDSLVLAWPDGTINKYLQLHGDSTIFVSKKEGSSPGLFTKPHRTSPVTFKGALEKLSPTSKHVASSSNDMAITPTLHHSLTHYGPSISVGDVNGDGRDDVFMGGDQRQPASMLMQQAEGFTEEKWMLDSTYHDVGSLLFDADNDGDLDLYVVSGGYHWPGGHEMYQDRLYFNDGEGTFFKNDRVLPRISSSGSCVIAADYDRDGDLDLFVGGRAEGQAYGKAAQSYLLENTAGEFINKSAKLGQEGGKLGMVTSALWTDVNNDKKVDLMVVGEWMKVTVLLNQDSVFRDMSESFQTDQLSGWWNSINGSDFDNDGDTDYVLGNYGLNSFYKATKEHPLELYAGDLDLNGSIDPVITHYNRGEKYVVHSLSVLKDQIPGIKNRFSTYTDYGNADFLHSFTKEEIESTVHSICNTMETLILENIGGEQFRVRHLPVQVQFSPVFGTAISDLNQDGLDDILLVGNSMHEETTFGNYDASLGNVLINRGGFQWEYLEPVSSGFVAEGDKKAMAQIILEDGTMAFLISENDGFIQTYSTTEYAIAHVIELHGDDWLVSFDHKGKSIKKETYHGAGFLSSSSRKLLLPEGASQVQVIKFNGQSRVLKPSNE